MSTTVWRLTAARAVPVLKIEALYDRLRTTRAARIACIHCFIRCSDNRSSNQQDPEAPIFFIIMGGVDVVLTSPNLPLLALSRLWMFPVEYTSVRPASNCRIFRTALSQENCGACAAFAFATFVSMHACLYDQEDFIPSPHRLFDCANGTCEKGVAYGRMLPVLRYGGVEDINESTPQYGRPCAMRSSAPKIRRHTPRITHIIDDPLQIKASLLLFGPLLGSMAHYIARDPRSRAYRLWHNVTPPFTAKQHAIVVVGWDAEGNWIVQNSWGREWGDVFGRGRIAQDVLAFVFDPTISVAIGGCYVLLVLSMTLTVLAAPKRQRRIYLAGFILIILFGLLPMMMWSVERGLL